MEKAIALPLPKVAAHADWSVSAKKRWMAQAELNTEGGYRVTSLAPVGDARNLIADVRRIAGANQPVLLGFDFPIGLPLHYARQVDCGEFLTLLPKLGQGAWSEFYQVAVNPSEIHLHRPFYPARAGGARQVHLLDALNVGEMDDLRRCCEQAHSHRRAAAPLFWTLGGQQVGKAAITGWRDVIAPALKFETPISIWPFSGMLSELLSSGTIVVAETYPGEFYHHLGLNLGRPMAGEGAKHRDRRTVRHGKRNQASRRAAGPEILAWTERNRVHLSEDVRRQILNGFGPSQQAEDAFDAIVGLFGMLNVLLGNRPAGELENGPVRNIEGWILGQRVSGDRRSVRV